MNADKRRLEIKNNSLDIRSRLSKIDQKTSAEAGRFEVIQALSGVYLIQRLYGFQFQYHAVLNKQVRSQLFCG